MLDRRSRVGRGFTLVELLVAMALMVILIGSVVFVFTQATTIVNRSQANVETGLNTRYAFDRLEQDLVRTVPGTDMEFFNDALLPGNQPGRWDPGEEVRLAGKEDSLPYTRSFTVRAREYVDLEGRLLPRDSIYFKTVATVGGGMTSVLVEYALEATDQPHPRLVRRTWRITGQTPDPLDPKLLINDQPSDAKPVTEVICPDVYGLEVEVFVKNHRQNGAGDYYSVVQLSQPPSANGQQVFEPRHDHWGAAQGSLVQTYYDRRHGGPGTDDPGQIDPTEGGLFKTAGGFTFPSLREGDKLRLGGAGIEPKWYTIRAFHRRVNGVSQPWTPGSPPGEFRIELVERITPPAGPGATVDYLASWQPAAIRLTVQLQDPKGRAKRTVSRVFRIASA